MPNKIRWLMKERKMSSHNLSKYRNLSHRKKSIKKGRNFNKRGSLKRSWKLRKVRESIKWPNRWASTIICTFLQEKVQIYCTIIKFLIAVAPKCRLQNKSKLTNFLQNQLWNLSPCKEIHSWISLTQTSVTRVTSMISSNNNTTIVSSNRDLQLHINFRLGPYTIRFKTLPKISTSI